MLQCNKSSMTLRGGGGDVTNSNFSKNRLDKASKRIALIRTLTRYNTPRCFINLFSLQNWRSDAADLPPHIDLGERSPSPLPAPPVPTPMLRTDGTQVHAMRPALNIVRCVLKIINIAICQSYFPKTLETPQGSKTTTRTRARLIFLLTELNTYYI